MKETRLILALKSFSEKEWLLEKSNEFKSLN